MEERRESPQRHGVSFMFSLYSVSIESLGLQSLFLHRIYVCCRRNTKNMEVPKMKTNFLTSQIIGSAIEVHKTLGPGLIESAYEECLCHELQSKKIHYKRQQSLPVEYKGIKLDCGYRIDLLVEDQIILELKAGESLLPIHDAQLLTYLKLANLELGLLINFNVPILKQGLKRLIL